MTAALLLLLLLVLHCGGAMSDCPAACECKWRSGKESAICAGANLTAVPRHLDYGTQLLDLTDNPLYQLGKDAFADAELLNLQKLYLSRCRLKALDRHAFRGLSNLVELDLSHNSVPAVPSAAFESVPELRELRLNGNPIMRIASGAFARASRLVRLDVSECRIALLESAAFSGLENTLEWLRLDGNQLREARPSTVVSLTRLHGVRLDGNPWNCSCKLRPLREWMFRRNVPYGAPPACKTPSRLANSTWNQLEPDDFACEPHSQPVRPVVVVTEGDNATVSCRMFGSPIPSSRWTRDDRSVPSGQTGCGRCVPVTEGRYTNLTIVSVNAQDGGSYVCELENRSGSSRSNVTVVVVKRSPELALAADRYALPGLIVGVILVLSVCLIFLCGMAIRTKGSPTRFAVDRGTEPIGGAGDPYGDRYEKIEMNRDGGCSEARPGAPQRLQQPAPAPPQLQSSDPDCPKSADPPDYAESIAAPSSRSRRSTGRDGDNDGLPPFADEPPSVTDRPTARPSRPTATLPRNRPRMLPEDPKNGKTKKTYLECNLGEVTLHHHVLHKEPLPAGHLYTTAAGRQDLCRSTKTVPDLLDTLLPAKSCRISQTLPRSGLSSNHRRNTMYTARSSGSQSPLLLGSRSSGGSNTSRSQLSFDSFVSSDHPKQLTSAQKSSSYLNLSTTGDQYAAGYHSGTSSGGHGHRQQQHPLHHYWTPPSLPSSPVRERRLPAIPVDCGPGGGTGPTETPILGPLSSRRRTPWCAADRNRLTGSDRSLQLSDSGGAAVTYDYHAAQLDMFLDEYKTLRKELTKMQRTCDSLRLSNASLASSALDLDGGREMQLPSASASSAVATASSSVRTTPKSILKNKNQATYVYRSGVDRRNSYHLLDPAPDDARLG